MIPGRRSTLVTYFVALAVTAAAVTLRWLLDPVMGDRLPLVTLFGAVAVAVLFGGYRPAVLATLVGYAACDLLFIERRRSFGPYDVGDLVGLIAYAVTCSVIIAIGEMMRTSRRQAAEQRDSLRVTLNSMGDAVIVTDTRGRVTLLNPIATALTGWTPDSAAGRALAEVFHIVNEQTRQLAENPIKRVLAEGVIVGLANHTVLIAQDGTEIPIDDSAAPIKNAAGEVTGCVLIFRDVSERRKAEEVRARLAAIVDSSEDAIIGKTLDGIITSWNTGAERIFGYSAAEALGSPIAMLAPPDRSDEMPALLSRIRRGERIDHFDTVRRAKDGRLVQISLTVSPILDEHGHLVGASKVARDITERKHAEQALFEEKARLHATLVSIGDAVIVTNAAGHITLMNPVAEHLTGFRQDNAAGAALAEVFHIVNEQTRQLAENPIKRVLAEGVIVGLANHTVLIAQDGTEIPIDDSAAPIKNAAGEVTGCVLIFRDVSERRKAEEALRESDRRKNEFLAILAHELRNPLAPVRNAIHILNMKGPPEPELKYARDVIDRQIQQMTRLIDDLMDLSRITRGKIELNRESVVLADLLHGAIETSRPLITKYDHRLIVNLPPGPIHLEGDLVRLAQVFSNLLNNAAKYTPRSGQIELTAEQQHGHVIVRVRDNGIGIPKDRLENIFEMFSQVQNALGRSDGGLGVGLSLVKTLVEMHSGSVEAHSDGPGTGSEFVVRLPTLTQPQAQPGDGNRSSAAIQANLRVLIVDDNRDAADSLALVLRMSGNETRTAYSGEEALRHAEEFHPDVIILDIGLPDIDGYEVCRRLRERPWSTNTIFIAMTGWGQDEHRQQAQQAGFDRHLVKPVRPEALMDLLAGLKLSSEHV